MNLNFILADYLASSCLPMLAALREGQERFLTSLMAAEAGAMALEAGTEATEAGT